jgi:diaminopimelate decarboxylase
LANRPAAGERQTVSIAGKACESGDILIKDIELPAPRSGDLLAVFSTGAYHFSMFSHYNRHLRPAVVFLSQGRAELVVRRESLADLTRLEQIPPSLEAPAATRAEGA